MAQERRITPEKQLLKLIEGSKSKKTAPGNLASKRKRLGLFSIGAWRGRFSFFKDRASKWPAGKGVPKPDIRGLNRILALFTVCLVVYLTVSGYMFYVDLQNMPSLELKGKERVESVSITKDELSERTVFEYLEKTKKRNIFKMGAIEDDEEEIEVDTGLPPSGGIVEATQHLSLVGISWSHDPDAMLEDTRAMRTFFVKRGQMIGDIKVKEIHQDRIILRYKGDEIELR